MLEGDRLGEFAEKPRIGEGWISGGFFVFEPQVFDYLSMNDSIERGPQPMDTLREKLRLESLWESGKAPWKIWE